MVKKHYPTANSNAEKDKSESGETDDINEDTEKKMMYLPIVDSKATMNLMYMIKMEELKDYC